jgi:cytochrome c-type biogenesis protein CcmH/NrfF
MSRWKLSLAAVFLAVAALGETPQPDSEAVHRVATHLACRCGACKDTVSCPMSLQGCHFCTPAKKKIAEMQAAGQSDQSIIDVFVKQWGGDEYRAGPNQAFLVVPYALLGAGLLAIFWFIRRYYRGGPETPVSPTPAADAKLDRYHDAIEKEMAKLD